MSNRIRVGIGYDVHALKAGRKLILGGVEIPFQQGLDGWSDADVVVHAVMDALLGAAALGDIGFHFPPGNELYKNISSLVMLNKVKIMLDEAGWRTGNLDVMIIAEQPKLKDYIPQMAQNISSVLGISKGDVSLKAGTNEGLGFVGEGNGMAAQAVVLLEKISVKIHKVI